MGRAMKKPQESMDLAQCVKTNVNKINDNGIWVKYELRLVSELKRMKQAEDSADNFVRLY